MAMRLSVACYLAITIGLGGCAPTPTTQMKDIAPPQFDRVLARNGLAECKVGRDRPERIDNATALFIGMGDHTPMRMWIEKIRYDVIMSNDLDNEFLSNTDGTGGPRISDAYDHVDRKGVKGWTWRGKIYCSELNLDNDQRELIFLEDLGFAAKEYRKLAVAPGLTRGPACSGGVV